MFNVSLNSTTSLNISKSTDSNYHLQTLDEYLNHTSIAHLNTRAICSTFDEFEVMLTTYKFDIIGLSETWLKDNLYLLEHVNIPGYNFEYKNRDNRRGGGVGFYLKEGISYKVRNDIRKLDESIENLWLEIKGKNKNSSYLFGSFYQPCSVESEKREWLDKLDNLLLKIMSKWDGIVILTGDMNIDMINGDRLTVEKYTDVLESFGLHQHVNVATRHNKTLIDHIVTNIPSKVIAVNVLPCDEITDHDAPYVVVNIKKQRFEPRYKYIRIEKNLDINNFKQDFARLPFSLVYAVDDPEEQLEIFNQLILSCINEHAPLKRIRFTRPPAPKYPHLLTNGISVERKRITPQ